MPPRVTPHNTGCYHGGNAFHVRSGPMNVNDNTAVKPSHKARRGLALLIIGGVLFLVFLALNNAARDSYDSTLSEASVAVALAMYGFIGVGLVLVVWGLLRD